MAKQFSFVLGLFFLLITAPLGHAVPYNLTFSFSGFSAGAPQDPVSGSLIFDKSPTDFSVLSVTSIDLTIDGHIYSVPPVSGVSAQGLVGSDCSVVCNVFSGADYFFMLWSQTTGAPILFEYTTSSTLGGWTSTSADTFRFAATPLPTTLPLFATGLGALGLLVWRRKRKQVPA
jgi:hypothetical protein